MAHNFHVLTDNSKMPRALWSGDAIVFDTPVWLQRYDKVMHTINAEHLWCKPIESILDFGCSELNVFSKLKQLPQIRRLLFMDIDEDILSKYWTRLMPINMDYFVKRKQLLSVELYLGSISKPHPQLREVDCVTAIEVLEHLYPDVLEAVPYNLFGFSQAKLIIFTTPNADFNVLFSSSWSGFRHPDHKFEWNRSEFRDWCENITVRFPDYTVILCNVGLGPEGTENFGCCSQMSVFVRKDLLDTTYSSVFPRNICNCCSSQCPNRSTDTAVSNATGLLFCQCECKNCIPLHSYGVCTYASATQLVKSFLQNSNGLIQRHLRTIEYPFWVDSRDEDEVVWDEFVYRIATLGCESGSYYNEDLGRAEIPLTCFQHMNKDLHSVVTIDDVRRLFHKYNNYNLEECRNCKTGELTTCVIYTPYSMNSEESTDVEASDVESSVNECIEEYHDWSNKGCSSTITTEHSPRLPVKYASRISKDSNGHRNTSVSNSETAGECSSCIVDVLGEWSTESQSLNGAYCNNGAENSEDDYNFAELDIQYSSKEVLYDSSSQMDVDSNSEVQTNSGSDVTANTVSSEVNALCTDDGLPAWLVNIFNNSAFTEETNQAASFDFLSQGDCVDSSSSASMVSAVTRPASHSTQLSSHVFTANGQTTNSTGSTSHADLPFDCSDNPHC